MPGSYAKNTKRCYPVIYFLHGFTDSDDRWFGGPRGHDWDNLTAAPDKACAAAVPEMIIVMPNALTKFLGSGYSSSVTTGDWETFVVRELVAYVDAYYRTIPDRSARGLAGHSLGGFGTLRLGLKYPDVYSSQYAMNFGTPDLNRMLADGAAQPETIKTLQKFEKATRGAIGMLFASAAWSPNPNAPPFFIDLPVEDGKVQPEIVAEWDANSILAMVPQYVFNLRRYRAIAFDVGDKDTNVLVEKIAALDRILTNFAIQHTYEDYESNHFDTGIADCRVLLLIQG